MLDFIYDLYKMDNFTLYLTIILVVLVIIFFVILIFGKKDQKLEETKRLQKIDLYSFKEEDEEPLKVEANEEKVEVTEFIPEKKEEVEEDISDTKEIPSIKFDEQELENDLKELESITEQFKKLNSKETEEKPKEVFSSVYVETPEQKEEATVSQYTVSDDDEEEMDLPSLR